jgi:hypothetical protein
MLRMLLPLVAALTLASNAFAEEPRKVNFLTVLTDMDGKPMMWVDCAKFDSETSPTKCVEQTRHEWTLSNLAVVSLAVQDLNETGVEQIRRQVLAQEIYKKGEATIDSKDTDTLCEAIAKYVNKGNLTALLTYRAWEILDPARLKK